VKNGWLPNPDLWGISTIGGTTHDGQRLLIVVLCEDNETEDGGIDLVQQITRRACNGQGVRSSGAASYVCSAGRAAARFANVRLAARVVRSEHERDPR